MKFQLNKDTSDAIKVVAALMVMFHHYSQYICINQLSDSIFYKAMSAQAGFIGVAVFFFLSGYGLMESELKSHLTLKTFIKKRFLKVYLPVLLVTTIWMLISPFLLKNSLFKGPEFAIGGGIRLIISNILINFGDEVLWFIKVLICLYASFYLFSIAHRLNKTLGESCLFIFATVITIIVAKYWAPFEAVSVPFFYVGVVLSLSKELKTKSLILTSVIMCLIGLGSFIGFDKALAIHALINVACMMVLIFILSIKSLNIKIPTIIAALSFDIYLVHNKVLMTMKDNLDFVSLPLFVLFVLMATITFYFLRSRIFKIK